MSVALNGKPALLSLSQFKKLPAGIGHAHKKGHSVFHRATVEGYSHHNEIRVQVFLRPARLTNAEPRKGCYFVARQTCT